MVSTFRHLCSHYPRIMELSSLRTFVPWNFRSWGQKFLEKYFIISVLTDI